MPTSWRRWIWVLSIGCLGLAIMYIFQRINYAGIIFSVLELSPPKANLTFILNRILRLLINDGICFWMIFQLFDEKGYRRISMYLFAFELIVILPVYLIVKLQVEGTSEISSPLLSFIHRLIVNPTLMLLALISFVYEKFVINRLRN